MVVKKKKIERVLKSTCPYCSSTDVIYHTARVSAESTLGVPTTHDPNPIPDVSGLTPSETLDEWHLYARFPRIGVCQNCHASVKAPLNAGVLNLVNERPYCVNFDESEAYHLLKLVHGDCQLPRYVEFCKRVKHLEYAIRNMLTRTLLSYLLHETTTGFDVRELMTLEDPDDEPIDDDEPDDSENYGDKQPFVTCPCCGGRRFELIGGLLKPCRLCDEGRVSSKSAQEYDRDRCKKCGGAGYITVEVRMGNRMGIDVEHCKECGVFSSDEEAVKGAAARLSVSEGESLTALLKETGELMDAAERYGFIQDIDGKTYYTIQAHYVHEAAETLRDRLGALIHEKTEVER